ncbi:Hypothetical protein GLP15_975 [Giardia lamblia P15]|uniref:Uncharacterized protein n=1 Tax=Giardia intestinalis (strain P15) TaxID=658858 RepID=E1EZ53_GIAIA|nr:Hypothetical protein GLP15_975 [Giardia lamblia P15]
MNNLTNEDIKAFANRPLTELVTLAGSYYMDGNDEEVVVCFNHLAKRLELEEKYTCALDYALADAHLSATISDYSSSAISLSQVANLLNAQDDATDRCTLPAYYTSVMSMKHLMGLHYLSLDDSVPPMVSEDTLERFLLYKRINLNSISQNVDYSFSIHTILARFVLDGHDTCIRHIYHNLKSSLLYFDAIIKASKRTAGLLESNNMLLNAAVTHVRLLIMRYRDSEEFIKNAKMISVKLLDRDLRLSYNMAVCTHACMHYSSRLFWRGLLQGNITFPAAKERVPLSIILSKLNYSISDAQRESSISRKLDVIFADLISSLQISNCSPIVRDNTILEFVELLGKYPLLTHSFVPFVEDKLKVLEHDAVDEAQETFGSALKRYRYFNENIIKMSQRLVEDFSELVEITEADSVRECIALIPGLTVFYTTNPGVVAIIYNFLQSIHALKEGLYFSVKHEGSEVYSRSQLSSIVTYADSLKTLFSTSIDGTFFDKTLFYFAWFLLKDYDANIEERVVKVMPPELALLFLETIVLAGQYVFVILQELEGSTVTDTLQIICEKVVSMMDSATDLLSLSTTTHRVLLSVILNLLDSNSLQKGSEDVIGITSATYMLICDVLSYKEPISSYGRFLRTVLHSFYTTPSIKTAAKEGCSWQKELLDLLQSFYNMGTIYCLDVRFEQILSRENRSTFNIDVSFGQIQALLIKMSHDYGISCSLLSTRELFSYRQEFDLDKWMVKHRIVKHPRPHRTRELFLDKHPYIQSTIRMLDTNSAYGGMNSIFRSKVQVLPLAEEKEKIPDPSNTQEPISNPTEDQSGSFEEDIDTAESNDKVIEPKIKTIPIKIETAELFAPSKEEQIMQSTLLSIYSNHGLRPRDLVTMSTLPGERLIALDSSHVMKYIPDTNHFAFICHLVKQLLTAEDITASALSEGQVCETVRLSLSQVDASEAQMHELLSFLLPRGSKLNFHLVNSSASCALFAAFTQAISNPSQCKNLNHGLFAEGTELCIRESRVPLSFLFIFLTGVGLLCKRSEVSISRCTGVPDSKKVLSDEVQLTHALPEGSVLSFVDLTGTDLRDVNFYTIRSTLTIERLYLNGAVFSPALFSALITCSINVVEIHMKSISLDCFKIASRINYEDIPGLKMIEVSSVNREGSLPYRPVFETFKSFGIEVHFGD